MIGISLHFAMRETQALMHRPKLWVGLLAAGIILGIAGPFGTDDAMRVLPRLAYWTVVVVITFLTGSLVASFIEHAFKDRNWSGWLVSALAGVAIGVVVTAEVLLLNWAIFGLNPTRADQAVPLGINAVVVSIVVTLALRFIVPDAPADAMNAPALLERLPFEKRGKLVALSVSDHYVEVTTTKGQDLVLMRLSDAILETRPEPGLQVHRSHWVALSAVSSARRDGAKGSLTLVTGQEIPVSRTYLPAAKEAGLLPR